MELVYYSAGVLMAVPLLLLLWAVLASPALLGLVLALRFIRRRQCSPARAAVPLAAAFSLLAAPVPTPIITVFIPHWAALLDVNYYDQILNGRVTMADLWWWIVPSLLVTFGVSLAAVLHYGQPRKQKPRGSAVKSE